MEFLEKFVIVVGIILIFLIFGATLYVLQVRTQIKIVTCGKDVMVCPDGSYAGRSAPLCQFVPCPKVQTEDATAGGTCNVDEDCIPFGKTGDCNCGCYTKENLPADTGGECFCYAPDSCKCVDEKCEGANTSPESN